MSRKQFCQSACAVATQLMLGDVCAICDAIPEWTFPYSGSSDCEDLSNYDADSYRKHVADLGLEKTWECICKWMLAHGESEFLAIGSLGELYEEGLAIQNKDDKKAKGQYYTPEDVSRVMSCWLEPLAGDALCDVGCGVGNLTLAYLSLIGSPCANKLLDEGRLHLYDSDRIAMSICITSIAVRYGHDKIKRIHAHLGDFLNQRMILPVGCKVISNPPYAAIKSIPETWDKTEVVCKGMELYSSFMEKIMRQSRSSVVITPYSFIGGEKFYPLRRMMNDLRNRMKIKTHSIVLKVGRVAPRPPHSKPNEIRHCIANAAAKGLAALPLQE